MKIWDRAAAEDGERIRFTSAIFLLWARRTKSLDTLLPVLYLRGISTAISRRRWRHFWARTHRTCHLR